MPDRAERKDEKGLSARYLILVFLMGVAACAVFFSLGFLVGYNERPSKTVGAIEEVTPTGVVPPTVNPPPEAAQPVPAPQTASASGGLPTEHISAPEPAAKDTAQQLAVSKPAVPAPKPVAKASPSRTSARSGRGTDVGSGYTVQVTASRDKRDAEKLVKELRSRGFDVFVVTPRFSDVKDNLYRVQVGPYATREEAVRARDRIAKEGFKPFIKH